MYHKHKEDLDYIEGIIRYVKKTKGKKGFAPDLKIKKEVLEEIAKNKAHIYYKDAKRLLEKWYGVHLNKD